MKSNPNADPTDVHVGARIATRRAAMGMTQTELANAAGPVSFQQFQKYETGSNRVSASRLLQVAVALGVPIQYFFDGLPGAGGPADPGTDGFTGVDVFMATKGGRHLWSAYLQADDDTRYGITTMGLAYVELVKRAQRDGVDAPKVTSAMRSVAEQEAIAAAGQGDSRHGAV